MKAYSMMHILLGCVTLSWLLILSSCEYHSEEELYPVDACDTGNVTYSITIAPVIALHCFECHSGPAPVSGFLLDSHANLKKKVDDGRLIGALRHHQGFSPMPQNAPALPECILLKIEKWVAEGAQDN